MESEARRIRARVTGVVQGVCFRATTQERARELGLVGWVRNTQDGAVELEAQGTSEAVDALLQFCHEGPRAARVRDVQVSELAPTGDESEFELRR